MELLSWLKLVADAVDAFHTVMNFSSQRKYAFAYRGVMRGLVHMRRRKGYVIFTWLIMMLVVSLLAAVTKRHYDSSTTYEENRGIVQYIRYAEGIYVFAGKFKAFAMTIMSVMALPSPRFF
ncbi:hypothetical protein VTK73DRAFT_3223 [Phialemonium thermophilum]|uniref:Uncharacterized protein n=1 Tax=Phialemonium thermophilum TaxID=223376 RepID=A0ABR3Y9U8_9PEZI